MRRALAVAALLVALAPMAPLLASLCETMPCCAGGKTRVSAPMDCCEPVMCAAPPTSRQTKAIDAPAPPVVAELPEITTEVVAPTEHPPDIEAPRTFPPLRVRLALIATLLI